MGECLYRCGSKWVSTQEYHVLPASASNVAQILPTGVVCNACNAYFAKLEQYFVHYHPGAGTRMTSLKRTKKGRQPKFKTLAGESTRKLGEKEFTVTIPMNDIAVDLKDDGSIVIKLYSKTLPYDSVKISRVLGKIAMETVWDQRPDQGINLDPYSPEYDGLRRYVRFRKGKPRYIWFAYRETSEMEQPAAIGRIVDEQGTDISGLCLIRFPGIEYVFPLPPVVEPVVLSGRLEGWTIVDSPGEQPSKDFDVSVQLDPRTAADEPTPDVTD
jgi:hypothetical protein